MKVFYDIALSCAMFVLSATALANPTEELAQDVLLPGTTIVAGEPKAKDFYVVTKEEAPKVVDRLRLAREEKEAAAYNLKYAEEHKNIRFNPSILAEFNLDLAQLLNTYAAYESKVTLVKVSHNQSKAPIKLKSTMINRSKSKRIMTGVTKPYNRKPVEQRKFEVKTLSFDKNHRLVVVSSKSKQGYHH